MSLQLYAHPFSSYCQKVLIALYEIKRFPLLVDAGRRVLESSVIIEHLQVNHPGPRRLLPEDRQAALETRMLDRVFDNYVMTPVQRIVGNSLRAEDERDPKGVADAREMLETAYRWLDSALENRDWAAGGDFSLADCAAAPALFYADWTHPIDPGFARLRDYRQRLLQRPSFARAVEEARPYRPLFPLGAPDRD